MILRLQKTIRVWDQSNYNPSKKKLCHGKTKLEQPTILECMRKTKQADTRDAEDVCQSILHKITIYKEVVPNGNELRQCITMIVYLSSMLTMLE